MNDLIHNDVLWASALAWLLAQLSKAVVLVLREHRFHVRTMLSAGGMPSSHSALVTALTTRIGMDQGAARRCSHSRRSLRASCFMMPRA